MDPDAIALATFLVREHDRATRDRDRTRTFPVMTATAGGRLDGIDTALAWLAGQYGHRSVEAFIGWVRARAPRPHPLSDEPTRAELNAELDPDVDRRAIPEGELRALDGNR